LSAHHDIAPLIANFYSSLFFHREKITGNRGVMAPRVLPAYTLDTYAQTGYLEGEIFDLMLEEVNPRHVFHFVHESVLSGWYVSANPNKYYLAGSGWSRRDYRHPVLIVGFDAIQQAFLAVTYKGDEFEKISIPGEALARALVSRATFERVSRTDYRNTVRRLRRFRPRANLKLTADIPSIASQLSDYLESRPPPPSLANPAPDVDEFDHGEDFRAQCLFGLAAYDGFKGYFEHTLKHPVQFDPRVTRVLWEHKKMMAIRLKHLEEIGVLGRGANFSEDYQPILRWAHAIHLACFDHMTAGKPGRHVAELLGRIDTIRSEERKIVSSVRSCLRP
jgi:hypothetical protein